jgi:hypothetical protein
MDLKNKIKKEITSDKNNQYSIIFSANTSLSIEAIKMNSIFSNAFSNNFEIGKIQENKYFNQFETINEIFIELSERIKSNNITLKENDNNVIVSIELPSTKFKEAIFQLNEQKKTEKETINDLINLVKGQNEEIISLKKEVNDLKDKLNILWKEREEKEKERENEKKYIANLESKIIDNNKEYNTNLKKWINANKNIRAELLYRMSDNGDEFSKFHKLCDNKGPTLSLFHVKDGNKVGIFTPLSWDIKSGWKNDMETFIFNLNKNIKCKKLKNEYSIYCDNYCGPYTIGFGYNRTNSMKSIKVWYTDINAYYENSSGILPNNESTQKYEYEILETEIFKIIIE